MRKLSQARQKRQFQQEPQFQQERGSYRRANLPRLLPIGPSEITGPEPETTKAILLKLARALRNQRRLGRSGHWTYDLNRHAALAEAWRKESVRDTIFS